jgi:hypothetical protein
MWNDPTNNVSDPTPLQKTSQTKKILILLSMLSTLIT